MIKFGTSGWRAIISDEFTFDNVRLVAGAIAGYIKSESPQQRSKTTKAVVGYDTRFLSEEFAEAVADVLAKNGISVLISSRDVPTPAVAFSIIDKKAQGGVNITASHNRAEYNGIKFSPAHGGPAEPEVTSWIERRIAQLSSRRPSAISHQPSAVIREFDPAPSYLKRIRELVRMQVIKRSRLKVVVDCMHGTSRGYLDKLLRDAGCKVEVLNSRPDPLFGGKRPEPSEDNLKELMRRVRASRADIGVATDGDADRFGIVDAHGRYFTPNEIICILFEHLLKARPLPKSPTVARTVATTHMIDAIAAKYDVAVRETPVGFKFIGALIREGNCIIGGEESGGLSIAGHVPEKDGILACMLACEVAATDKRGLGGALSGIERTVGKFYNTALTFELEEERKRRLITRLNNIKGNIGGCRITDVVRTDGIKFLLGCGEWMLFRESGTEPLVRVYIEARSASHFRELKNLVVKIIKSAR